MSKPKTLLEAIRYFSDPDTCTAFVAQVIWPDGPFCPACACTEYSYLTTRRVWKCKACKKQYSVKVGTIFENSPLPLSKWLPAVWLISNSKNGISSHELGRALGITQKSAWFMLHRIRLAMQTESFVRLSGEIEVDETYIGGKARNMHAADRKRKGAVQGRSTTDKVPVLGMVERGGRVKAEVVPNVKAKTLRPRVIDAVEVGSALYTDAYRSYTGLDIAYDHQTIDHAERYVDGKVHTNSIESFWSLLKRSLSGTYISVEPFHLFRYIDERVFAFNQRRDSDYARFEAVLGAVGGRRLTYAGLIGALPSESGR
jgi:transposase-like protein